jgi:hypothetical protein
MASWNIFPDNGVKRMRRRSCIVNAFHRICHYLLYYNNYYQVLLGFYGNTSAFRAIRLAVQDSAFLQTLPGSPAHQLSGLETQVHRSLDKSQAGQNSQSWMVVVDPWDGCPLPARSLPESLRYRSTRPCLSAGSLAAAQSHHKPLPHLLWAAS